MGFELTCTGAADYRNLFTRLDREREILQYGWKPLSVGEVDVIKPDTTSGRPERRRKSRFDPQTLCWELGIIHRPFYRVHVGLGRAVKLYHLVYRGFSGS
jgi:hypothetical protein